MDMRYYILDVFTDQPFQGNPLAIVEGREGLESATMQEIAWEFNFSETLFLFPPANSQHDAAVRIFTPKCEVPFAGHPLLGAGWHLAQQSSGGKKNITLETQVGIIPLWLEGDQLFMSQLSPVFGANFHDLIALTGLLGLSPADLFPGLPCQAVSTGIPWLFVPLARADSLSRIELSFPPWQKVFEGFETDKIMAFAPLKDGSGCRCRAFAPLQGVKEDPATGSAQGALGAYLAQHHLFGKTNLRLTNQQGGEMGRPSLIEVVVHKETQDWVIQVGGQAIQFAQGTLQLP